ncbi:tetratricopeptide repeat protein [Chondromyces apiculatus]|uniref:Uncharacterized protein n=1 Tax=Chondromyces apiculatus DSM 436 TaxID=1192034 RepID=A0A017T6S0_9BACT|nr:tetratricopeptide repeat protein [Chondromyces apiculatus]EYF04480.1 Hypothetical protein CAP_4448 [Chondromyces apiculatus DSM 436]
MPSRDLVRRVLIAGFAVACLAGAAFSATVGCSGWDPSSPFERNSPAVNEAIEHLDAGRIEPAEEVLTRYLGTGQCSDAGIGLPDAVRQKPNGSFDLGLTLFYMAERYGRRFGEEELGDAGAEEDDPQAAQRAVEIECALILVQAIAADPTVPADLRARARYLAGNLEFMRRRYKEAVAFYDQALAIIPGILEEAGGDGIGRDTAWNRAIALRRIEDQERDAAPDAPPDSPPPPPDGGEDGGDDGGGDDGGDDGGNDAGDDGGDDGGNDGGGEDAGDDGGPQDQQPDAGGDDGGSQDAGGQPPPQQPPPQSAQEARQDERVLDQLEEAPTYQEEEAKNRGVRRGRAVMEDK